MTDRYKELREALAAGPTAGPWWCDPLDWYVDRVVDTDSGESIGVCDAHNIVTGKYIAAADPDTIRELLAERDELRAEVEQLRSELADAREEADDGALIVMHITQDEALHDEFLAWYKPDEWLNSRRAACSFVAMKLGKAGERP